MSIGILSCVWQRPERLGYTLGQLAKQTNEDWHLYLVNNNPEHKRLVGSARRKAEIPMTVIHNQDNRGPYSRWLVAREHAADHTHFMTLDDDVNFGDDLLEAWDRQKANEVLGWMGFIFQGDYWHRREVAVGEPCHYVWGSNMLVPSGVVLDTTLDQLAAEYVQCDDLWICYIANHIQGLTVRRADIAVAIEIDGKDTYPGQHRTKVQFLESLRRTGWANDETAAAV